MSAARAVLRDPRAGLDRVWERINERRDRPAPDRGYASDWEQRVHAWLGAPWPCPESREFAAVWEDAQAALEQRGLATGRGAYGGWDDADPALARTSWCLVCHLRPAQVIETGVARGITSRAVLEALERNGRGHLWSIDLAPLLEEELAPQIATAVPADRRERWTLLEGSSRRVLPRLLAQVGEIDLFVHDSLHTERNVRFELSRSWPSLRRGGAMLIDDVERSAGFHRWLARAPAAQSVVGIADDRRALVAIVRKP
jgi:predicted O-methyltransferase YrrM